MLLLWLASLTEVYIQVYEVTTTMVETMERNIERYLRKWLVYHGTCQAWPFIKLHSEAEATAALLMRPPVEEWKVAKARLFMMLRDSADPCWCKKSLGRLDLLTSAVDHEIQCKGLVKVRLLRHLYSFIRKER